MNAKYLKQWCLFLVMSLLSALSFGRQAEPLVADSIPVASLPSEARQALAQVRRGPPYAYAKDGVAFGNHERLLPKQPRGYYREFTVRTAGSRNRGARRLIIGGTPAASSEIYYTADHYASFIRVQE